MARARKCDIEADLRTIHPPNDAKAFDLLRADAAHFSHTLQRKIVATRGKIAAALAAFE